MPEPAGGVAQRRRREGVELGQDRDQAAAGRPSPKPGRSTATARRPSRGEQRQRVAPRVGAVGVAVEHDDRRPVAFEFEHPGLVTREVETMLEQRLDHVVARDGQLAGRGRRFGLCLGLRSPVGDEVALADEQRA